ncbi:MAG: tetratricopeptide repeat protein [Paracoccaceae bacterium]
MGMRSGILAALVAFSALVLPARADFTSGCIQSDDTILRIEACTRVIQGEEVQGGNIAWAFNNRGLAYEAVQRFDRALADYNAALLLDPTYAVAYNNRGNVYALLGNLEAALADHTRAVELDPEYAQAFYNRGADYEEFGDTEAAIADYTRALEIEPDYTLALVSRAAAYCVSEDIDAAVGDYLSLLDAGHFTPTRLQEYLQERGFYRGAIDGIFGRGSRGALRAWAEAGCP